MGLRLARAKRGLGAEQMGASDRRDARIGRGNCGTTAAGSRCACPARRSLLRPERSPQEVSLSGTWGSVGLSRSPWLGTVQGMPIRLENVGIAVRDLEAAIAFFTDLGLIVLGRDTVSGEWTDTAVGLDGNHAKIAMLQTPDGNGR